MWITNETDIKKIIIFFITVFCVAFFMPFVCCCWRRKSELAFCQTSVYEGGGNWSSKIISISIVVELEDAILLFDLKDICNRLYNLSTNNITVIFVSRKSIATQLSIHFHNFFAKNKILSHIFFLTNSNEILSTDSDNYSKQIIDDFFKWIAKSHPILLSQISTVKEHFWSIANKGQWLEM